jgi:CDP-ribitol ribitolphosphotransferase
MASKVASQVGWPFLVGFITLGRWLLQAFYQVCKLRRLRERVLFMSRQGDQPSEDFILLDGALQGLDPRVSCVTLCKKIKPGLLGKVAYVAHMFKQIWYLASARFVIIDSYCLVVSLLKHRPELKVLQIWHAMGAMKKAAYSSLDKPGGRSSRLAKLMRMHRGYDYVLASSPACVPFFAEMFNVPEAIVQISPLPHVDLLLDAEYESRLRERVLRRYPQLADKQTILWAPTFRSDEHDLQRHVDSLCASLDFERYNLIFSPHPLSNIRINNPLVIRPQGFSSLELAMAADHLVCDYSSIIFDYLIVGKPLYFFCFDLDDYGVERGLYIDYRSEVPGRPLMDIGELLEAISSGESSQARQASFLHRYVRIPDGSVSDHLAAFVLEQMQPSKVPQPVD